MFDYYEPLRTESPDLWNYPFVVGFHRDKDTLVLFKGFAGPMTQNPVVLKVVGERQRDDGSIEFAVDTGAPTFGALRVHRLTVDYIVAHRELYPFDDAQLTGLLPEGNLSLYAQATIPQWYEEQYPPPPEQAVEAKPEYRDVNGVLYERAADGSWVKAK